MRKDWDSYFMDIAFKVSTRSTCPRLSVGAVIVKNKRIKGTGYNGSPVGLPHCDSEGCFMIDGHCRRTIHAEVNALMECSPEERTGATLYITHQPCIECQKLIISSGIAKVIYSSPYESEMNWFEKASHIKVIKLAEYNNE